MKGSAVMRDVIRIKMFLIAVAIAIPAAAWAGGPAADPECEGKAEGDLCRLPWACAEEVLCDKNLKCGQANPINNVPCESDNNACTVDRCDGGTCMHHKPVNCDDENECTVDTCNSLAAEGKGCQHAAVVCDDGNKCTVNSCNPRTGCDFTTWITNDCEPGQCGTSTCGNDCGECVQTCIPEITCPGDVSVECVNGVGTNTLGAATATCDAQISSDGNESYAFSCGDASHQVTYTATNGDGSDTCLASLTIVDTAAPSATCGPDVIARTSELGGECTASLTPSASGTDTCEGALTGTCDPEELTQNGPGTTSANCTVADCSKNLASCRQSLTLIDDTPPTITCATPLVTPPAAPMSWTASSVTDNCGGTTTARVTSVDCYMINGAGKVVSKLAACKATYSGNRVSVGPSAGGVGTIIKWTVSATDEAGNVSNTTCMTQVQNPGLTR